MNALGRATIGKKPSINQKLVARKLGVNGGYEVRLQHQCCVGEYIV